MTRDELIEVLLKHPNLEVKINADYVTYDVLEEDIFHCVDAIFIQPDE